TWRPFHRTLKRCKTRLRSSSDRAFGSLRVDLPDVLLKSFRQNRPPSYQECDIGPSHTSGHSLTGRFRRVVARFPGVLTKESKQEVAFVKSLSFRGMIGWLERESDTPLFQTGAWFRAEAVGDGVDFAVAPGALASVRYLWADMLLDGDELAVFLLRLQRESSLSPHLWPRSEEHTSELQSREKLVCRLLL